MQVCEAVQHAHQKAIIHRDIKPTNILVAIEGNNPVPKIIDFGVAKAISQPLTERTLYTEQGQFVGTPEYMSPEQAQTTAQDIDTRSDIYSLGVVLYELLIGALPFDPKELRKGGVDHIRQVICETEPRTPSTRLTSLGEEATKIAQRRRTEVGTLAKRLHKELEWIPLMAMRKERTRRYRSASELADDIQNYLKGAPLIAGPESAVYQIKKFVKRKRALVTGIAAVLVVLIAGVVVSTVLAIGQARARAEAERQAKISQAVSDFLREDLLASVDPTKAKGRELTVRSFLDTASENLKGKFKNEPLVEASIRHTLGWTYRMLGHTEEAEQHMERAYQIYRQQLGDEHPETLDSMGRLGWVYSGQGRRGEAERLWAKQLEISRRVLGDEHPITLKSMNDLAIAYMTLGRDDEAEQLLSKGLQTSRRVLGEQNETTLFLMGNLAKLYEKQGRYDEAEQQLLKTLEIQRRVWGDENPYTLAYMNILARVYRQQGRYDEAEALYLKTLKMHRRVMSTEHPRTLRSMNGLAELYRKQKRYDEAEPLFVEVLESRRQKLGDGHPDTLETKNDLAVLYKEQARYDEAEPLLLETLEGRRKVLGEEHPDTLGSLNNLIELYEAWGKPQQAEQWRAKLPREEGTKE